MSGYKSGPDIQEVFKDIKKRLQEVTNSQRPKVYTTAQRPTSTKVTPGVIIYVSDAAAGSQFQGWNGSSWVSLG